MHEGAVMQAVVNAIIDVVAEKPESRVTLVALELGASGHFTEEAVRQYFQLLTSETPASEARLELAWLPALFQCMICLTKFESTSSMGTCPQCSGIGLEIGHRDTCKIRRIEIELPDA